MDERRPVSRMESLDDVHDALERNLRSLFQGHPGTADYVQEAKVAVWQKVQADPETPYGFLFTIGRSRAIDVARGQRHLGAPERSPGSGSRRPTFASYEVVSEFLAPPTYEPHRDADGALLVQDALSLLDDDERWIVETLMDGASQREAAAERGVSQAWISRRRLPSIRAKLAHLVPDLRMA